MVALETDHFLVWAQLPSIDAARLAMRLESVYERLAGLLGADRSGNRFWGKAVILYFADPDRLRLVEADSLWAHQGREPLYLLDDVLAELDDDRSERVIELLEEGRSRQVIFTAPKRPDLPLRGGRMSEWSIRDGELNP